MKTNLDLGPDVIQRLIPHRRPMLMVDRIDAFEDSSTPSLSASRYIAANEPIFDGHFPGLSLWPGVYTIEGLLQASNLVNIIWVAQNEVTQAGGQRGLILEGLRNLELGYRLQPGYRPELTAQLSALFDPGPDPIARGGMVGAVDIKLLAPVFAGSRLDYRVTLTRVVESMQRFDVEASVQGKAVAKGTLTGTRGALQLGTHPGAAR